VAKDDSGVDELDDRQREDCRVEHSDIDHSGRNTNKGSNNDKDDNDEEPRPTKRQKRQVHSGHKDVSSNLLASIDKD
jgi:hypothetical protein